MADSDRPASDAGATGAGVVVSANGSDTVLPSAVETRSNGHDVSRVKKPPVSPTRRARAPLYAALDLGTNNCRLLIARPVDGGFRVMDGFTRIVRLGEGVSHTGRLSEEAMLRTIEALRHCRIKIEHHAPRRVRLIATEACRSAENSEEFLARVRDETGLELEIVDRRTEAELAVTGCADLIDSKRHRVR